MVLPLTQLPLASEVEGIVVSTCSREQLVDHLLSMLLYLLPDPHIDRGPPYFSSMGLGQQFWWPSILLLAGPIVSLG